VSVLDPGRGKTKTGRLWVLVRDERPWGGPAPPAVTYLYSPNRKSEHARTLLEGCRGFLHGDGYAGFNGLYEVDSATSAARLVEVACWAHCRRKLFEVHAATGSAVAQETLERMATLFKIEAEINGHAPEHRHAVRQERSLPLLADLGTSSPPPSAPSARSRWAARTISLPDRDPERARSRGLPDRRHRPHRRPPDQPDRPAPALELDHFASHRSGRLTRPRTSSPSRRAIRRTLTEDRACFGPSPTREA
jgi:Transposase IS66 family